MNQNNNNEKSIQLQGVWRELTKSIGLLHSPQSIPRTIIRWEKLHDVRTCTYLRGKMNINDFLNYFFNWLQFHSKSKKLKFR